jgi:carbamoyltransferase
LNTSFNRRGEPVVATARDAAEAFAAMDLDALVLGPFLVGRRAAAP